MDPNPQYIVGHYAANHDGRTHQGKPSHRFPIK